MLNADCPHCTSRAGVGETVWESSYYYLRAEGLWANVRGPVRVSQVVAHIWRDDTHPLAMRRQLQLECCHKGEFIEGRALERDVSEALGKYLRKSRSSVTIKASRK